MTVLLAQLAVCFNVYRIKLEIPPCSSPQLQARRSVRFLGGQSFAGDIDRGTTNGQLPEDG